MAGYKLYTIDKQNIPVNLFIWSTITQDSNYIILHLQNKINIPNAFNKKSCSICGFYGHKKFKNTTVYRFSKLSSFFSSSLQSSLVV